MTTAPNPTKQADTADFELFIEEELRGRTGSNRDELEHFLRSHPGEDIRDWKHGSTRDILEQDETDRFMPRRGKAEYVRALATRELARRLPREVRQAAARDASLAWNDLVRRYRPKTDAERLADLDASLLPTMSGHDGAPPAPMKSFSAPPPETGVGHERK